MGILTNKVSLWALAFGALAGCEATGPTDTVVPRPTQPPGILIMLEGDDGAAVGQVNKVRVLLDGQVSCQTTASHVPTIVTDPVTGELVVLPSDPSEIASVSAQDETIAERLLQRLEGEATGLRPDGLTLTDLPGGYSITGGSTRWLNSQLGADIDALLDAAVAPERCMLWG